MIFNSLLSTAIVCIILLLCRHSLFIQAFSQSTNNNNIDAPLPSNIRLRLGFPDDDFPISMTMAKELMNPLSISHNNNMIVAEDTKTGERVGWAQIRSLGYAGIGESNGDTSLFEDDGTDDSALNRRNIQTLSTIEEDIDEEMWQEFEDDPADFPNGFASLPWSKEYQAASQSARDR